jgi:UDP-N-acetylglucosamine--dolichyl-phosphate N-acetylglucosaminephosphotransferase
MILSYVIITVASFVLSIVITPKAIWFLRETSILGIDQQKKNRTELPTSGGVIVAFGFLGSILGLIAMNTFIIPLGFDSEIILVVISSVLIATFVGLLDDLNVKKLFQDNKGLKDYRVGLKQWQKPLFTLPVAIPLMVVGLGTHTMQFGSIILNFGILYPLIIIPLAVVFCANAYNMLAGMNGLESGMGIVCFGFLGIFSMMNNRSEAAIISLATMGATTAFYLSNRYPSKVLPGDSLTYLLGALYVSVAVVGNIEKFALICFIPWIIEFFLKLRSGMKARSLGILQKDGTLKNHYDKNFSLTHIAMRFRLSERNITFLFIFLEFIVCTFALALVGGGIV